MARVIPEFPRLLLAEKSHAWNLLGVAATSGPSAQSVASIIRTEGGGFWSCKIADVSLSRSKRTSTLLWRAVRQICNGGVSPIILWRNDALFRPWPGAGYMAGRQSVPKVPHSDTTSFSDGSFYYQNTVQIFAGAADLRTRTLSISVEAGAQLLGGEAFSIEHLTLGWRLYEIATVVYSDADSAVITFNPPLREAIADNTRLEFDRPRCTMRLGSPSSMDLTIDPWTYNYGSADFVETFETLPESLAVATPAVLL